MARRGDSSPMRRIPRRRAGRPRPTDRVGGRAGDRGGAYVDALTDGRQMIATRELLSLVWRPYGILP